MRKPKLLVFAGSLRKDSLNKKLARAAASIASASNAEVTFVDLADFPMPLYDQDIQDREGISGKAKEFKELLKSHDAMLIVSPEYNSSISGVLKNAIDWASRTEPGESGLAAFAGKTAALLAASPGALGGLRGLVHLRSILGNIQVLVIPEQYAMGKANESFDAEGNLSDDKQRGAVEKVVQRLISVSSRMLD